MLKKFFQHNSNFIAHGTYRWMVMEGDSIINESPLCKNYIFTSGLNMISHMTWADVFKYARVGDAANPIPSTGNYEFVSGAKLQQESTNPIFQVAGPSRYFTGIVGRPYFFNGCDTEPLTGEGDIISGLRLRRTFDFAENPVGTTGETPDLIITEIGFAPSGESSTPLFSRIITHTGDPNVHVPVVIQEGQFLRVIYELNVAYDTGHVIYTGEVVSGYTGISEGETSIQLLGLSSVGLTGNSQFFDASSGANEPSVVAWGFLSDDNSSLANIGNCNDLSDGPSGYYEVQCHQFSYANNSFYKVKRMFVSGDYGVHTGWNCMGIGLRQSVPLTQSGESAKHNSFVYKFNEPFNKEQEYILNVLFRISWSGVR